MPKGAQVKAVTEAEKVILIRGPFEGMIGDVTEDKEKNLLLRALAAVLKAREALSSVITRGEDSVGISQPWMIDITTGGAKCVSGTDEAILWQPAPQRRTSVFLSATELGVRKRLLWPRDQSTVAWPTAVPIVEDVRYLVDLRGLKISRTFKLHIAHEPFRDTLSATTWMLSNDCDAQALLLLSDLPVEREVGSGSGADDGS